MATANELYAMVPKLTTHEISNLVGHYFNHIEEVECSGDLRSELCYAEDKNTRIQIRYIKDHCYDGRRTWTLATVWLDHNPVMIIQNAGREGDDHSRRFITDRARFIDMCVYIRSLINENDPSGIEEIDPDEEMSDLTCFYGRSLYDSFRHY